MRIAFVVAALLCAGEASAGDVLVPAHRTRDGSYVPANVAPNSSGSYLARRPGKGSRAPASSRPAARSVLVPPLLANAQPIRK